MYLTQAIEDSFIVLCKQNNTFVLKSQHKESWSMLLNLISVVHHLSHCQSVLVQLILSLRPLQWSHMSVMASQIHLDRYFNRLFRLTINDHQNVNISASVILANFVSPEEVWSGGSETLCEPVFRNTSLLIHHKNVFEKQVCEMKICLTRSSWSGTYSTFKMGVSFMLFIVHWFI